MKTDLMKRGSLFVALSLVFIFSAGFEVQGAVGFWSSNGPIFLPGGSQSGIGYITSLGFSPNFATDGKIFAGSESGHVYMSDDRGLTWRSVDLGSIGSTTPAWELTVEVAPNLTVFAASAMTVTTIFKDSQCSPGTPLVWKQGSSFI